MLVAAVLRAVLLVRRLGALDHVPQPLQQRVHEGGHPAGERRQQVGEVGAGARRPVAGHVGLAEADLRVGASREKNDGRPDQIHHRGVLAAGAEDAAVGEDDADRERRHRAAEDQLGDAGVHRRRGGVARPGQCASSGRGTGNRACSAFRGRATVVTRGSRRSGGRGTTGSRRNHSFPPCNRISALTRRDIIGNRSAAPQHGARGGRPGGAADAGGERASRRPAGAPW